MREGAWRGDWRAGGWVGGRGVHGDISWVPILLTDIRDAEDELMLRRIRARNNVVFRQILFVSLVFNTIELHFLVNFTYTGARIQ